MPHCQRQGMVTSASDYSNSNEGEKREVATKPTRNIPPNIPQNFESEPLVTPALTNSAKQPIRRETFSEKDQTQACQPQPDMEAKPQPRQQIDREVILDGIITDILDERKDQDRTWGGAAHDDKHSGFDWVALITKQQGRAVDGANDGDVIEFCTAMVRTAALAVAAIESVRRLSWARQE